MTEAAVPAPREPGWGKPLLALAAFLLLPLAPLLAAMFPVVETFALLVPALAVCMLVGWWQGGRLGPALVWIGLTVWLLVQMEGGRSGYGLLVQGWGVLLAGAFGLVCVLDARRAFLARALLAITLSLFVAVGIVLAGSSGLPQLRRVITTEYTQRNGAAIAHLQAFAAQYPEAWERLASGDGAGALSLENFDRTLRSLSTAAQQVYPALLALESLAALALAWVLYHRLSRSRLGVPLRPLREFRFNDQLVWGLIVGLTVVLLPTLAELRGAGANLLVFFSALYALRGLGVLSWFLSPGGPIAQTLLWLIMFIFPVLNLGAVLLGVGDTWFDWRRRARPTP